MNICFLDKNKISYDHNSLNNESIRGAERVVINLALKLNSMGHKVTVLNYIKTKSEYQNIRFINIASYKDDTIYDLAISNNDLNNFNLIKANKKIAISHSIQTIEKFVRKNQLLPFLKHKPKIFLLGNYHKSKRSFFTRMFGSEIINWAVDDDCINAKLSTAIDPNKALFTSYPDRNLDKLISVWISHIYSNNKNLKLYVSPTEQNLKKFNIFNRKLVDRKTLIQEMLQTKVFLIPGHPAELYCLAAEEAKELCVPIVTFGIGSLSERVTNNITGFIAKDKKDFAKKTLDLFQNQTTWKEIRNNLVNMRNSNNWDKATNIFLNKCRN